MSKEIERKFLVPSIQYLPQELGSKFPKRIEQGYIVIDRKKGVEQRIRRTSADDCFLTVKTDGGLIREEWETLIPEWVYLSLLSSVIGNLISKQRYEMDYQGHVLEIDVFDLNLEGLIVVECEFKDEDSARAFVRPDWLINAQDVTNDSRFKNKNLALKGIPY